ncbi:hypothetical protein GOBAR_DD20279 [Gossypium barbadense]|nr:hypothetical protein GOBAR_DD20279 [Gossypium barbadense]
MGKLTSSISIPVRGGVNQARGNLVVKHCGGSSGLPIAKDVAIGTRSVYGLDAIFLERNEGRLGVNKWWWILPERGLSSFICHGRCVHINSGEGRSKSGKGQRRTIEGWVKEKLVVKRCAGSSGLPISKDVAIGTRSVYGLDAIFLERNEGRLEVNKWWWILPEQGLSSFICHGRCVV